MPPTEEEVSKFDTLRENVVKNECRGFLEARQTIDELLNTINHYLGMSIDLGRAPTPEEIEEARQRAVARFLLLWRQLRQGKLRLRRQLRPRPRSQGRGLRLRQPLKKRSFNLSSNDLPGEAVFH